MSGFTDNPDNMEEGVGGKAHLFPFVHTENPVRVVSVLADAVQFNGVAPLFGQVLLCTRENTPMSDLATWSSLN